MTGMTKAQREELAKYYSTHSTAEAMTTGEWVNEPAADPMVTTSLRLPVELMQAVRAMAAREGLKPTALMRRWVEDAISGRGGSEPAKDDLQGLSAKVDQVLGLLGNVVVLDAVKGRRGKAKTATHTAEARTTSRKSTSSTSAASAAKKAAPAKKTASTKTAAKKTATAKTTAAKTAAAKTAAPARTAARSRAATAETSTRTRASAQRATSSRSVSR